jgi:branched-chain amino acid aminotransferase
MEVEGPDERYLGAIRRAVEASGCPPDGDAYVRLVVTRGVSPLGLKFDAARSGAVVVVVADAHRPTPAEWARGLRVALVNRLRVSAQALDPAAKTGNYMNNLLALHEARLRGADDAVLLNDRAQVTEASTANVYRVHGGRVETPPLSAGILEGTTRSRILALCARHGRPVVERDLVASDLLGADEVFVSSSVRGVLPVVEVDGTPLHGGVPGPVTTQVRAWFEAEADAEAAASPGTRGPARPGAA